MNSLRKYVGVDRDGHKYLFRYNDGDEAIIINAFMDYVKDENCTLDIADMLLVLKEIRNNMHNPDI